MSHETGITIFLKHQTDAIVHVYTIINGIELFFIRLLIKHIENAPPPLDFLLILEMNDNCIGHAPCLFY